MLRFRVLAGPAKQGLHCATALKHVEQTRGDVWLLASYGQLRITPISAVSKGFHTSIMLGGKPPKMPDTAEDTTEIYSEMNDATHLGDIPRTKVEMHLSDIPHPHLHKAKPAGSGVAPAAGDGSKSAHTPGSTSTTHAEDEESGVLRAAHAVGRYANTAEVSLMRAMYIEDRSRFRMLILVAALLSAGTLYTIWPQLKRIFVTETSDVASQLLGAKDVQDKASIFAKAVLNETLNDRVIFEQVNEFIQQLLTAPQTRKMALELVTTTLDDEGVKAQLNLVVSQLLQSLSQDPSVRRQLLDLLVWLCTQPDTQAAMVDLLNRTMADPHYQEFGAVYLTDLFSRTFANEPLKSTATHWLLDILRSDELQRTGGDFLYAAYKNSITPSFLRSPSKGAASRHHGLPAPHQAPEVHKLPSPTAPIAAMATELAAAELVVDSAAASGLPNNLTAEGGSPLDEPAGHGAAVVVSDPEMADKNEPAPQPSVQHIVQPLPPSETVTDTHNDSVLITSAADVAPAVVAAPSVEPISAAATQHHVQSVSDNGDECDSDNDTCIDRYADIVKAYDLDLHDPSSHVVKSYGSNGSSTSIHPTNATGIAGTADADGKADNAAVGRRSAKPAWRMGRLLHHHDTAIPPDT